MKTKFVKKHGRTKAGREILEALNDLHDTIAAGIPLSERYLVRKVHIEEPTEYDAQSILATRHKLRLSQSAFAMVLGISTTLVQSWEQGRRVPAKMACRLLDEVNRQPARWRKMIRAA